MRVTQGRFIICAAMCQPHCVVDSIVRLATRSGHLATILHPTKPAAHRLQPEKVLPTEACLQVDALEHESITANSTVRPVGHIQSLWHQNAS